MKYQTILFLNKTFKSELNDLQLRNIHVSTKLQKKTNKCTDYNSLDIIAIIIAIYNSWFHLHRQCLSRMKDCMRFFFVIFRQEVNTFFSFLGCLTLGKVWLIDEVFSSLQAELYEESDTLISNKIYNRRLADSKRINVLRIVSNWKRSQWANHTLFV